jgi:hypothetical protein
MPLNQIRLLIWSKSLVSARRRHETLIGKNDESVGFINNYYVRGGAKPADTADTADTANTRRFLSLSLTTRVLAGIVGALSLSLLLSRSLVQPVESIYVHECGFEPRPLLSRDYRRKEGRPNQYLTQTFRLRPRHCCHELLLPFEGRSHRLSRIRRRETTESLINLPFYPCPQPTGVLRALARTREYLSRARVRACVGKHARTRHSVARSTYIKLYGTVVGNTRDTVVQS